MEIDGITAIKGEHKAFHHGGRLGDAIFALYTVKELGGGVVLLSDFHVGNWDEKMARSLLPLIEYQDYVKSAHYISTESLSESRDFSLPNPIDYDLHDAELDYNPESFPEWQGGDWPGNINIVKRYAVHFGVPYDPEAIWLTAPKLRQRIDVAFHAPMRRLARDRLYFVEAINQLGKAGVKIVVIGNQQDIEDWSKELHYVEYRVPKNMLEAAEIINTAKVFLGAISSCNAIAEGLKKDRYLEVASDCFNTYPFGQSGHVINDWTPKEIADRILLKVSLNAA